MRFKSSVREIGTFVKLAASLNLLGNITWMRLDDEQVRFTVIPEQGSQVWAVLSIDAVFDDDYTIQSATTGNAINLEVPLGPLHRALKTAQNAHSASLRLTKKDNKPVLCLTITTVIPIASSGRTTATFNANSGSNNAPSFDHHPFDDPTPPAVTNRETTITQDIAVRVLAANVVSGIHEPRCKEPEVHIMLPSLIQLKSVSERFTKLALASKRAPSSAPKAGFTDSSGMVDAGSTGPRLEIAANMHGELKMGIRTDALRIESKWTGLSNPDLDSNVVEGGEEGIRNHPSTKMRDVQGDESWAIVRVEGRDWGRVLGVGRLGGRVVACFCHETALILYVYLPSDNPNAEESVLTYYIGSYSE